MVTASQYLLVFPFAFRYILPLALEKTNAMQPSNCMPSIRLYIRNRNEVYICPLSMVVLCKQDKIEQNF